MLPTFAATYSKSMFQPFYTDAKDIRELMLELLGNIDGLTVLEPCAGQGAFIHGLHGVPLRLDAIDIDERHIRFLRSFPTFVRPIHADFIDHFVSGGLFANTLIEHTYDAVICNPPYGLRFSVEYRKKIKRRFPQAYVRESYGLFMYFAISALRSNGRYVFIVPDTFLTSRNHLPLRKFILDQGCPSHVIRFPSRVFGTVNFGYGNLCIIAGNRRQLSAADSVVWAEASDALAPLSRTLSQGKVLSGTFLKEHCINGWVDPSRLEALTFNKPTIPLGELAECRTGLYTGDNVRFCGFDVRHPPLRANGHPINWEESVHADPLSVEQKKNGLTGSRKYVPFVRGGHRKVFERTTWAVDWSETALKIYRTDKRARLQNHTFYFREGLAIPMVTSGRFSASYMTNAVFDQGVVGVFPHDAALLPYLLIYLNSGEIAERVKAAISPGANNSANYVKRIPVVSPSSADLALAHQIIQRARARGWEATLDERDQFMRSLLS